MRIYFLCFIVLLLFAEASTAQKPAGSPGQNKEKDKDDPLDVLPALIRGPYLQKASPHSILIRWRTDALSRSRVRFGKDFHTMTGIADDSALVTEHKVLLNSLEP